MHDRTADVGPARYAVNADKAIWRAIDGEAAIVHADTSFYYGLNATGTFIWTLLTEAALTFDELVERVSAHYRVSSTEIAADVRQVLDQLKVEDLITER